MHADDADDYDDGRGGGYDNDVGDDDVGVNDDGDDDDDDIDSGDHNDDNDEDFDGDVALKDKAMIKTMTSTVMKTVVLMKMPVILAMMMMGSRGSAESCPHHRPGQHLV